MPQKSEEPVIEAEAIEPEESDPSRGTTWLEADEIGPDMVQLPYIYLLNGRSELDKQYPGEEGKFYLSGMGVFDELQIIPVQAGRRQEDILRGSDYVREDVFRLIVVEASMMVPAIINFRGTSKQAFRQLMSGLKWGGRGFERVIATMTSREQSGQIGSGKGARSVSWYVPAFDLKPDMATGDECAAIVARVMRGTSGEIEAAEAAELAGNGEEGELPF